MLETWGLLGCVISELTALTPIRASLLYIYFLQKQLNFLKLPCVKDLLLSVVVVILQGYTASLWYKCSPKNELSHLDSWSCFRMHPDTFALTHRHQQQGNVPLTEGCNKLY